MSPIISEEMGEPQSAALASASRPAGISDFLSRWTAPNFIAMLAVAGIALHLVLRYLARLSQAAWQAPLIAVLLAGGIPLVVPLVRKAFAREFGSDHLAGISIVTSVLLGEYLVGVIVILMLSGGAALEGFASRRASSVLDALARRMPQTAHRKTDAGLAEVKLEEIAPGDVLEVFPHETCPADGVVIAGQGNMDEAYLTGEPYEMEKAPGSEVISGAINGEKALTIRAEKRAVDSRYARIMRVMEQTQQQRPRMRRLGDTLGAWYTPVALTFAAAAWAWSRQPDRFLAVLVVATPCPLLIAIPVAVIGAISLAARRAIIIRNPAMLEQVDRCSTLVFDKTGTLTYGKPALSEILCAPAFSKDEVLGLAASVERYSKHPLSTAIQEAAQKSNLPLAPVSRISERPGEGLRGAAGSRKVWITSRSKLGPHDPPLPPVAPGLECVVVVDDRWAGVLRFADAPRSDSSQFIKHLKPRHAVNRVLIVSGDRDAEVRQLAGQVGIGEVHSAKSPEEKVDIVRAAAAHSPTLFLGDGINDAPAMQAATVGVAFGVKSDVTSEAADAVVLETSLSRVDELMHIGRRMRRIALESAVGGMALSILGMIAAAFGYLPPIGGAIAQEIIDLAAVLNAVRVALPTDALSDF
ncbi:MAG TPA: heavy metal translocating P-type ATPase [Candidatus Acidoferrales bacterium]|nr:heavy metal translocating P-type ATPase [Candidatus Acidoferrales bacterium]